MTNKKLRTIANPSQRVPTAASLGVPAVN
jgi:hypothetical protein